ncbi:NADH-quinone oxidoreductase subunit L [Paenibacillus sp. J31TS4]|uniref:NADH-quinone oxidoreductase subunit L n=1 Tax=Paenibacillus sp. J31TS4 TaxID=2807195 RepID=UPI001B0D42EF|nr:NADH-quinone oxidoreductase subunit L [Paenibacillus sp. J31TS4]GIP40952.1 NADH-quinone oxidoreductase subunit L [Paenibacillus sp. J31TS4]
MGSDFSSYAWIIPLFPLFAFLVLISISRQTKAGPVLGTLAAAVSLVLSLLVFVSRQGAETESYIGNGIQWLKIGDFTLTMGYEVTNLNALMLVIVTLVSLLVNLYSIGYMRGDERINVFFGYVALFTFSMLGLVISVNLLELYIFWELVGVCSFLLIGFWYQKPEARAAAKKAFIVTRVGDVGLFLAILLLFWYMPGHALDFYSISKVFESANPGIGPGIITLIAILLFVGAMGKSGQFPLHTWLPDAMEGPTPISALIHAATMVAAGVYLVARMYPVFLASPDALTVVAIVGAVTALFAATIGTVQNDIKRVLAYSTVSQLGYMMMALGIGTWAAYNAAIFHLFTHAFFKALLFLGAGSVIHAVHTNDINQMGGLGRKMKVTAWTFGIGALALAGVVPLSGFWSKDAILTEAYHHSAWLFGIGLIAAFFTAFYMARLFFLVFSGPSRTGEDVKESPSVMTVPLLVLAVLAVASGAVFIPGVSPWLGEWLTDGTAEETVQWLVVLLSQLAAFAGIALGWAVYRRGAVSRDALPSAMPWLYRLLERKYYIDEIYQGVLAIPLRGLGQVLEWFDRYVVDGLVRLVTWAVLQLGRAGTRLQNGQVQTYGLVMLLGFLILIAALAGRRFLHVG